MFMSVQSDRDSIEFAETERETANKPAACRCADNYIESRVTLRRFIAIPGLTTTLTC